MGDEPLSNVAFRFNLRRYTLVLGIALVLAFSIIAACTTRLKVIDFDGEASASPRHSILPDLIDFHARDHRFLRSLN
jgi:hypothetical protein